ncbi:MAG: DUF4175 family protein [Planctomycetaceae bacterium]|nr:DUF4175 family protein [Planctomycetaceae bacterium]
MTQLAVLRSRLQSLRAARAAVQRGAALSWLAAGGLARWGGAWWLDWMMGWDRASRTVILFAWFAAVAGMLHRWIRPLFGRRESVEQLALWVERQHRLDGDLVSALQFESPEARTWGSPRLTHAVIDYVAVFSRGLNVFDGFTWQPLPRCLAMMAGLLIVAIGLCVASPAEASVFWNRFWLGAARYPTRTVIDEVVINGRAVTPFHTDRVTVAVPQDEPLSIEVRLRGEVPPAALAVIRGLRSGERGQWPLQPSADGVFTAAQPHLPENLRLWIRAGDAETDPVDIAVVPLPVVDVRWSVEPPRYAGAKAAAIPAGTRSFAVLAGSRISCTVSCANKSLQSAMLRMEGVDARVLAPSPPSSGERGPDAERAMSLSLVPTKSVDATVWSSPAHPQLNIVQQPLRYELLVVDADGLSPQPTIAGEIRLQTDRPPRVVAAAVSRKVLPQAQPRLSYGASDDFGVGEIRLEWEVVPENGPRRKESRILRPRNASSSTDDVVRGETVLDLRSLGLSPGDEVRVVVAAEDDRGDFPAQTGRSEPVVLEVTDKNGILESLLEIDQQSAKQLDAIIEKELGIGGPAK